MADENVTNLTTATMELVDLQLRLQRARINSEEYNRLKEEIQAKKEYIQVQRDAINIAGKTYKAIERETEQRKANAKEFEKALKALKEQNLSLKEEYKERERLRKLYKIDKQFDPNITLATMSKNLKALNFAGISVAAKDAGGWMRVFGNSLKALGGAGTLAGGALAGLAMAGKFFVQEVALPSARMRNAMGQQLGIGFQDRALFQQSMFSDFMNRIALGYNKEQYAAMAMGASDILRTDPRYNMPAIEAMTKSMGVSNRLWGTDVGQLSKVFKAYYQAGTSADKLAGHFDKLMRNVEGTGFSTQEYTDILATSGMYLKNFGVNLDTFAAHLKGYGGYLWQGKITAQDLTPANMAGADTGRMAFLAQMLQKYGGINLGVSEGTTNPLVWSAALKSKPLSGVQVTEALKRVALTPGSPLSGLLAGAKNPQEAQMMLWELFNTQIQQLSPYKLSAANMSYRDFTSFGADISKQKLSGTDTSMLGLESQVLESNLLQGDLGSKLGAVGKLSTDWIIKISTIFIKFATELGQTLAEAGLKGVTKIGGGNNANP